MSEEVAVFVDLENLRYGLLNHYGLEPNFQALVEKAGKYGRPSTMRAYADFTEHPPEVSRALQVAGIEAINIQVKRTTTVRAGQSVERVKNAADMVLALDAVIEAIEADKSKQEKVFLIVTGDRDYVKLVTLLRHRFGQRVVVVGVPGSVAGDLVTAAGESDLIDVPVPVAADIATLKKGIVAMLKKGPSPLQFWTLKIIDQWVQDPRQGLPGSAKARRDAISALVGEGVLVQREIDYKGKRIKEAVFDERRAHDLGYDSPETKK